MSPPQVSVVMSVYNGLPYLEQAVQSILDQTFEGFEFIVVDDASTDRTPEILAEYEMRDNRMRVLRNSSNRKLPASLNRGLAECRAPIVARADADDIYKKDRLSRQLKFMERHPEVGLVSSNIEVIDADGNYLRTSDLPHSHEAIRLQMNYTCPISHPAVMFRRDVVWEAGGYDEEVPISQDVELWGRLVHRTRFANLAPPLVKYRRHEESNSANRSESGAMVSLRTRRDLLADYLGEDISLDEADALHAFLRRRSAKHSRTEVEHGLSLAKKLQKELRRRGLTELRGEFESELFKALCSQSIKHGGSGQPFGRQLLCEAVCISPRQIGQIQGLKRIAAMIRG